MHTTTNSTQFPIGITSEGTGMPPSLGLKISLNTYISPCKDTTAMYSGETLLNVKELHFFNFEEYVSYSHVVFDV